MKGFMVLMLIAAFCLGCEYSEAQRPVEHLPVTVTVNDGDPTVYLESSIATKYPKLKLDENVGAKIGDDGKLVLPLAKPSIFDEQEK